MIDEKELIRRIGKLKNAIITFACVEIVIGILFLVSPKIGVTIMLIAIGFLCIFLIGMQFAYESWLRYIREEKVVG